MAFFHYDGGVVADQATGRPLMGQPVKIFDEETDTPVQAYREGLPVSLVTGAHGLIGQFQTEDSTRRVRMEVGPVRLRQWSQEMIEGVASRLDQLDVLTGLTPGDVTDAQTAQLLGDVDSMTRSVADRLWATDRDLEDAVSAMESGMSRYATQAYVDAAVASAGGGGGTIDDAAMLADYLAARG